MSELLSNNENIENSESIENAEKVETWDKFNLNDELLRGIYAYGFEVPIEIQKKALLLIIMEQGNLRFPCSVGFPAYIFIIKTSIEFTLLTILSYV